MMTIEEQVVLICGVHSKMRFRALRKASVVFAALLAMAAVFTWAGQEMMMLVALVAGLLVLIGAMLSTARPVDRAALERAIATAAEDSVLKEQLSCLHYAQRVLESESDQRTAEALRADRKAWWRMLAFIASPLLLACLIAPQAIWGERPWSGQAMQYGGVVAFLMITVILFAGPYPTMRRLRDESLEAAVWRILMASQKPSKGRK